MLQKVVLASCWGHGDKAFCFKKEYAFKRVIHLHHELLAVKKSDLIQHYFRIALYHCAYLFIGRRGKETATTLLLRRSGLLPPLSAEAKHDPSTGTNFCNTETGPELDALGEKSLLMPDTDGEDVIQPCVKKSELSL